MNFVDLEDIEDFVLKKLNEVNLKEETIIVFMTVEGSVLEEFLDDFFDLIKILKKTLKKSDFIGCLIFNKEFYKPKSEKRNKRRKKKEKIEKKKSSCFKSFFCCNS